MSEDKRSPVFSKHVHRVERFFLFGIGHNAVFAERYTSQDGCENETHWMIGDPYTGNADAAEDWEEDELERRYHAESWGAEQPAQKPAGDDCLWDPSIGKRIAEHPDGDSLVEKTMSEDALLTVLNRIAKALDRISGALGNGLSEGVREDLDVIELLDRIADALERKE